MPHRIPRLALLAAALLAACSPAASVSPSPTTAATSSPVPSTATPAPSPLATPLPSVVASPSPAAPTPAGVLELQPSKTAPLVAGTYTRSDFKPKITLRVTAGSWYCVQVVAGFFDIEQDVGSPDVIAVQFGRPQEVYTSAGFPIVAIDAQTAATLAQANPALKVVGSSQTKVGGLAGYQTTLENDGTANANVMKLPAGALSIAPGRRLSIVFLDTKDGLLAIMTGGSTAKWQAALDAAQPVLDSITIAK